jgi:hypothetical protein
MNDRTLEARAHQACDDSPRRRRSAPSDIPTSAQVAQIAERREAVRRNLQATFAVTDIVPDLIEVSGDFPKVS